MEKRMISCDEQKNDGKNAVIVNTPDDAIKAFRHGHLDVLVLQNFVVRERD
jgi:predicted NodU family carbamoyl transferase